MKSLQMLWLIGIALPILFVGCAGSSLEKPKAAAAKEYDVRGKVVAVNPAKPAVTLDHEDIPGLMKAMEMEFSVENAKLLDGIKAGDQVQARLKKSESGYVITQLQKRAGQ
jgi:protein SCO1/2